MSLKRSITLICLSLLFLIVSACASAESLAEKGVEQAQNGDSDAALTTFEEAIEKDPEYAEAYYQRAILYLDQEDFSLAAEDVLQVMALDPSFAIGSIFATAFDEVGLSNQESGRLEEAIASYSQALQLDPTLLGAYQHRADAYLNGGLYEAAAADVDQILAADPAYELEPYFSLAYAERAASSQEEGRVDEALADFQQAAELDPENVESVLSLAGIYLDREEFDTAAGELDRALSIDPEIHLQPALAQAFYQRGLSAVEFDDLDSALADMDLALKIDGELSDACYERALIYYARGETGKAKVDLQQVLAMAPDYDLGQTGIAIFHESGLAHLEAGDYVLALADLEQVLALDAAHAPALAHVGLVHAHKGDTETAISYFEQAREADSEMALPVAAAGSFLERATAAYDDEAYDEAMVDLNLALEIDPNNAAAFGLRGRSFLALGQSDEAVLDLLEATLLDPANASLQLNLGWAYAQKGEPDQALDAYDKAIELDEENFDAFLDRAELLNVTGETEAAIADLSRAIEINPESVDALFFRGLIYGSLHETESEIADFTRVIELDPKYTQAFMMRGLAYGMIDEFELALSDMDTVLELSSDPAEIGQAHFSRGALLAELGRNEEAIVALEIALEYELMPESQSMAEEMLADLTRPATPPPAPAPSYDHFYGVPIMPGDSGRGVFNVEDGMAMSYLMATDTGSAVSFYRQNMPAYGWQYVSEEVDEGIQYLFYFKGETFAGIGIGEGPEGTIQIIIVVFESR